MFPELNDYRYDEVDIIKIMTRDEVLAIKGMKKGHASKIMKSILGS